MNSVLPLIYRGACMYALWLYMLGSNLGSYLVDWRFRSGFYHCAGVRFSGL